VFGGDNEVDEAPNVRVSGAAPGLSSNCGARVPQGGGGHPPVQGRVSGSGPPRPGRPSPMGAGREVRALRLSWSTIPSARPDSQRAIRTALSRWPSVPDLVCHRSEQRGSFQSLSLVTAGVSPQY